MKRAFLPPLLKIYLRRVLVPDQPRVAQVCGQLRPDAQRGNVTKQKEGNGALKTPIT